jgi:DNA helicase-2/ATP-dependent DNA helicase PcrA
MTGFTSQIAALSELRRAELRRRLEELLDEQARMLGEPAGHRLTPRQEELDSAGQDDSVEHAAGEPPSDLAADVPGAPSVSELVDAVRGDVAGAGERPRQQVPTGPSRPLATTFREWVERRYARHGAGVAALRGGMDQDLLEDRSPDLERLQAAWLRSSWRDRMPAEIETPFAITVAGLRVRGRIDAVFIDADGGRTAVDWKINVPPRGPSDGSDEVQLACYRLAVSDLTGLPLDRVRAAFHYVLPDVTVAPVDSLDAAELADVVHWRTSSDVPLTAGELIEGQLLLSA